MHPRVHPGTKPCVDAPVLLADQGTQGGEKIQSKSARADESENTVDVQGAQPCVDAPVLLADQGTLEGEESQSKSAKVDESEDIVDLQGDSTSPVPCAASPAKHEPPKPNFTGEWDLERVEGDIATWMSEVGVGWTMRKMAQANGWGVGSTSLKIQSTSDRIAMESTTLKGTTNHELQINGSAQDDYDLYLGKTVKVAPRWEDVCGRTTLMVDACGTASSATTKRWMEGESLVVERTNPKGTVIRTFFKKR